MCIKYLSGLSDKDFKKPSAATIYQKLVVLLETWNGDHPAVHPKQEKVKSIALQHFTQASQDGESGRIIVFASYRDYVTEIVQHLNEEDPIIRAIAFYGQGKRGEERGMTQKEQLEVGPTRRSYYYPLKYNIDIEEI
jgi:ATP-dependent DNA helicase MPH1